MKRAFLFGGLAGAVLLLGQGDEPRVFVDYREVMIPMRDGVRLQTVILTPRNPKGPLPFLIDRTPYGVPAKDAVEKGLRAGPALAQRKLHFRLAEHSRPLPERGQVRHVPPAARSQRRERRR